MADTYVAFGAAVFVVGLGLFYRYLQYRQRQAQAEARAELERSRREREDSLVRWTYEYRERAREERLARAKEKWGEQLPGPREEILEAIDRPLMEPVAPPRGLAAEEQPLGGDPVEGDAYEEEPVGELHDRVELPTASAGQDAERGTRSSRLPSTEEIRPMVQGVVTIVGLGVGFWIILGGGYTQSTEQWATGLIGLVVGFWLKA